MQKETILGYDICEIEMDKLLESVFDDFNNGIQNFIVNINPEIVVKNLNNEVLKKQFNKQKYQIPDGFGIVLASKIMKGNIRNRITGIDLMEAVCKESIRNNGKIFLYGAKPEVVEKAKINLEGKFENINIVGFYDGYGSEEIAVQKIKASGADIVFVALGSPKQENFILKNKDILTQVKIFLPVGGSFDVFSDTIKRAPKWIRRMNLEWLYRLLRQPSRLFRQMKLVSFVMLVLKEKRLKKKQTIK